MLFDNVKYNVMPMLTAKDKIATWNLIIYCNMSTYYRILNFC